MTIEKAFKQLEETVVRNIANDIIQIEFHTTASDDEIRNYYGGGVNRLAMIEDSFHRLESDILMHAFISKNNKKLIKKYGDKKPDGRLASAIQRNIRDFGKKRGRVGNAQEATEGTNTQGRTHGSDNGSAVHEGANSRTTDPSGREGGADTKDQTAGSN